MRARGPGSLFSRCGILTAISALLLASVSGCLSIQTEKTPPAPGEPPVETRAPVETPAEAPVETPVEASAPAETPKDSQRELELIESLDNRIANFHADGRLINYEEKPGGYGLGYCVGWTAASGGAWATVYFFHAGMAGLRDGVESEGFKKMWGENTSERTFANAYRSRRNMEDTAAQFHGVPFRRYGFTGFSPNGNRELRSNMFMTVYQGTFLKVRIDYFLEHAGGADEVENFMDDLVRDLEMKRERYKSLSPPPDKDGKNTGP